MADYKKAYKTLGIKTITASEFEKIFTKFSKTQRGTMLDTLAKNEKAYATRAALDKALKEAGLI